MRQSYEEDQELESTEVEEAGVPNTMEVEDPMLAVALQNQSPV